MKIRTAFLASAAASIVATAAIAAPVTYTIDSKHTYPSFAADHFGGLSTWRGKLNSTTGKITYDAQAQSGTVEVSVDMSSIDFGNDQLNEHAKSAEMFDVAKYPTATYTGKLGGFRDGKPTEVDGTLELHGVTKPVKLKIESFLCKQNPINKKDTCGANASATINREEFGVNYGKNLGFHQEVKLEIQVEAVKGE
jgi:polyisoprenoid-binding protein YceI